MTAQNPYALQNGSHSAALFRQAAHSPWQAPGVIASGELAVSAQSTPNMSVQVAGGRAWIKGTQVSNVSGQAFSTQSSYFGLNDAPVTVTIATANATNPRVDLVYVAVNDSFYSGTNNNLVIGVVTGTPAPSPVAPAAPSNSVTLALVAVAANATSITNSNITASAVQAALRGGFIVCTSTTHPSSPVDGQGIFETDTRAYGYYEASSSRWLMFDTVWQTFTPVISTTAYNQTWTQGNGTAIGRYLRKGREISVECHLSIGSTSVFGAGPTGPIMVSPPSGYYPSSWSSGALPQPQPSTVYVNNGGAAFGLVVLGNSATANQRRFTFYTPGNVNALNGATGTSGSWNFWSSGQNLLFSCTYETAFEA